MASFTTPLRRLLLALVALACVAGASGATPGEPPRRAPGVVHLAIEGPLDEGTLGLLQRATRRVRDEGHRLLVVEIDTPGGEIGLMVRFARQLQAARQDGVRTAAWIHGEASSAGALVALSCDRIYLSSGGTMGSATPVTLVPGGLAPVPEEGGVREKLDSRVRSEFRAAAQQGGRSGALAEAMVDADLVVRLAELDGEEVVLDENEWSDARVLGKDPRLVRTLAAQGELVNLTAQEAIALGMADGVADDLAEVLLRSGLPADTPVTFLERSNSEDLLALLATLTPFLIGLGLLFGYAELKTQGFGAFGVAALACFTLVFAGRYLVGLADVPHLVLLVLGLALVALELFLLPGHVWPGVLGGLLLVGALLAMEVGSDFDWNRPWDRSVAWEAAFRMTCIGAGTALAAWILSAYLPDTPLLRRMVQVPDGAAVAATPATDELVGTYGTALTDLRPVGKVALDARGDAELEARAEGAALDRGARVVVVATAGARLVVQDAREPRA